MLAGFFTWGDRVDVEHRERTFFGVYQIEMDGEQHLRTLMNGTTMHGVQSQYPDERNEPLSYYGRTGPIGQVFDLFADRLAGGRIAVVGLGTGTLAAYARDGERWTFYEIDPAIARISGNRRYFTHLPGCGDRCRVVLGDARISLARVGSRSYALIVLDAFSSDAIPVHLITREALALYVDKLADHGVVAFHVSNRHLELRPVLGRLARDLGLTAYTQTQDVADDESDRGLAGSDWVVIARTVGDLEPIKASGHWSELDGNSGPDWTDDFSNILAVLSWK
jgi:hypothetical protein